MRNNVLLFFLFTTSLYAAEYECIERHGDYKIVFEGTRDAAYKVSGKNYTSRAACNRDLDNFLKGIKAPVEYECIERHGDYKVVFKGTRDAAYKVSGKNYTSRVACNRDLDNFLKGIKAPVEYECIERHGDYKVVFKGTRDAAYKVSGKNYTSRVACNRDLDNFLKGIKAPVEYECIERHGDYKVVFKGTRDAAYKVSGKNYTSRVACNRDLDNFLKGIKAPVEYECIERHGDYKVVFKGTRDAAYKISGRNYTSFNSCKKALNEYLSKQKQ